MIRHIWSVLCQSASFDVQTNNVSLQNILESLIVVGELNTTHPILVQAEIVSLWARENIDLATIGQMRAFFTQPNGNKAPEISLEINLSQGIFHRTRINIPGLMLVEKGEHLFHIEYQIQGDDTWFPAAKIPLIVINQNQQPTQ